SDMSSASNSLAREFLSDVSHLCNAVDQRVEAREEEEEKTHIAALGQYLIQGRGFILLTKLNSIIDQELTCREDLLTLLLSLLPLVWKIPVDKEKAIDFNLPFSVEICLTKETTLSSLKLTQEKQNIGENVHLSAQASGKLNTSWKNRRQRKTTHRYSVRDARKSQISTSDSEGNSDEKTSTMIRHRRPQLLQPFLANQSKEQSVTSGCNFIESEVVQSCNYGRENTNSQQSIPVQESIVQASDVSVTSPAICLDNSPFDLCHVLLSLLEKICKFDIALNHKSALAASVIGTLTEFLSKLGDCYNINSAAENEAVSSSWTGEPVALVQRMLFRTVLHLMAMDVNNAETMPGNLRKNLTDLLKAALKVKCILDTLFNPFASRSQGTLQNIMQVNLFSQNRHRFLLLPEFIEGVLQILICCLQSAASNPIYFSQAMDLVHEFIQQQGFKLFETTAIQMEGLCARDTEVNTEASECLKVLINSIMKIISTIKKVKSEQLHQSVCTRKRHRRCEYSHFMHHHRDLSGLPVSTFKNQASKSPFEETADGEVHYPDRCCCIAICAHQCLRLLQKLSLNSTCFQILTGIHNVGICCCMDPKSVISPLLHSFRSQTFKNFQPHILSILNKFILDQLGGLQISQKVTHASCNICSIDCDQLAELDDFLHGNAAEVSASSSSAPYRFQGILPSRGSENMFLKWDALEAYQSLVFEDDDKLRCMQIASHICSLIQKGNEIIQWKLYNYIFNPVLQRGVELTHYFQQTDATTAFSQTSGYQKRCLPQEVLQIYLQTLPLLFKSRIIQELFLSCNGINQIIELNYLDSVRAYSLKVFETLILSLGDQQTDQLMPNVDALDSEEKVPALDLDVSVHRRQMVSDVPQSLSKFYAGLKEVNPKKKRSVSQDVYLNMINIFLCVTFLCVSKEAEADRDSTNDSEDTSGYDSTASEPFSHKLPCLSFESLTLPSLEHIHRAADTWSMCRSIYLCNALFQRQFHRLGGFEVCHRLIAMIIEKLGMKDEKEEGTEFLFKNCSSQLIMNNGKGQSDNNTDENLGNVGQQKLISYQHSEAEQASTDGTAESKHVLMQENGWSLQGIRLLEALLAICLHSANNFQQKPEMESLQNIYVEDILLEMKEQLTKARVMETELVKPLFDSLLRVALGTYFTDLDRSEEKKEKSHQSEKEPVSRPDDMSEEADESQCYCFKFFAEEKGYDADSESNSDENESKDEGKHALNMNVYDLPLHFNERTDIKREQGCFGYCSVPSDLAENIIQGELIYPELCMLELHLLSVGSPSLDVLTHVFHSFLKVVRLKEKNTTLLMQQGAVKSLLGGFLHVLTQTDSCFHECQKILVDLLVSLMSSSTSSEELTLLLRIFLEKTPAMGILLKGILKILEANTRMRPLQHIVFPLHQIPSLGSSPCQKSAPTLGSKTVALLRRAKLVQSKKEPEVESLPHHLLSPWHVAPIHLPLVGQNCWPHMSEGFSISLWFSAECVHRAGSSLEKGKRMKRRSKSLISHDNSFDEAEESKPGFDYLNLGDKLLEDGCLHIFSLGSKALMIQVWANVNSGAFTFRMCMDPNDEMKAGLLAQAETPENTFLVGKWQHLALTYIEQPENKKNIHGTLSLWICGQRKPDICLDYTLPRKMSLSSDCNKTFCMTGHYTSSQDDFLQLTGKWSLGNLLLFNGATIGPKEAFYLYAGGPDFTSVMPCKYGKSIPNYSKYIDKEILQCEQIKELLLSKKEVDTGPLIENLATVYTTCCPGYYTIYEPVIRLKGQMKTIPSQRPFSSKEVQSNLSDPHYLKMLQPAEYKGLQGILHEIGGIGSFVFLFARVVEISSCEETQALALKIILVLTKHNQQRIHELENCNGYSMIHQTLLEGCCNEKMIHQDENGQFMLDMESRAIIQDVKLLEELLFDWKIWSKAQQGVWKTLLSALETLIQDNHWQQLFNIKQLLKARVVHHFLQTCQVLQEHKEEHFTSIPSDVCTSFVKIIEEVLGSPPDLELLRLIFNFLVAVHPATNTYVCHNPRDFYFSLHIDGNIFQEKVQSIMYMRNSSSGGKSVDSPVLARFSAVQQGNDSSEASNSQNTVHETPERLCKSLPSSPVSSPRMHQGGFFRNIGWSAENLHEVAEPKRVGPLQKNSLVKHTKAFKRTEEEHFISSCESAKTVVGSEDVTPAETLSISKEEIELLDKTSENHETIPGAKPSEYNVIPELSLKRPDNLKGVSPLQKSHGNLSGLGLAFSIHAGATVYRWPSYKNVPSEDWEHLTFSSANEWAPQKFESMSNRSTEDSLVLICHGLYHLLRRILLILPDVMLPDVLDKLVQPDILIVLVNHPSTLIQQGVIKLLNTYFSRATREQKEKFLKNRGFSLLANQLYLHQGTPELMECFLEMLFGRSVGLDEDFNLEDVKNAGLFQKWCVIPVLGLIENSLHDCILLHNSFCFLLQIINSCSKMADMLLDNGLLYVLCNTLATLNGLEANILSNDSSLLVCDIQQLLAAVTIHACSCSGTQYFRIIEDLMVLLGHLQMSKNNRTRKMAVNLQFTVLQSAVKYIKTVGNPDSEHLSNSLHLSVADHQAIFQKRKSIAAPRTFSIAQSETFLMLMHTIANEELDFMMLRRMSQDSSLCATEAELIQRLQRITVLTTNRFMYQDLSENCPEMIEIPFQNRSSISQLDKTEKEDEQKELTPGNTFLREMFKIMIEGIGLSIGTTRLSTPKQQWKKILLSCKDTFRVQLGRLLVHALSPTRSLQEQKHTLEFLHEINQQEILRDCLSTTLQHGPKLTLYLFELMHDHKDELTKEEQISVGALMNTLKLCGYKCIPLSAPPKPDLIKAMKEDHKKYVGEEEVNKASWEKIMANNWQTLFQRLDAKSKEISKIAGDITQAASLSQGMERKKVIQHIRGMYKTDLSASRHWQELIQQFTHDRALWYDPASYPTSWQLDPTEGPNRERRRLQRCYLTIPNKYLLKDRQKLEEILKPPLAYLFEDKTHSSHSSTVKDKAASEHIRVNRRCINVAPSRETPGELLLGKCGMYFVEDNASEIIENSVKVHSGYDYDDDDDDDDGEEEKANCFNMLHFLQSFQGETEPASFSWTFEEIKEVHKRWWQLRDNAVEIFLTNGRTLLLAFDNTKVRDDVYHNILTNNLPNLLEYGNITALTHLWYTGQITNFEYLTHLNKHAGRSFNDLMQYPVFPFILSDYTNETLDLNDPSVYRNLIKPIAVQSKEKEDRYVDTYKYLEEEYRKGAREDDPMPPVQPYHYGSHYSNSGTVLHFLVRMPPFTKMFLAYQDQSFDIPDRTFHSTNTTWRLSSYESMTDVKELIPEFFYLPEFLVNREGFDFGVRQNGERVNHVNLPPWARNDPRLFILIHRQALESDHVSQTICHWIDLVFGYKQKGKASVQAMNVFHPATYFGMDVSAVEDPVQRRALETMIKTYGQTPRQLFHSAHVSRSKLMEGELPAAMGLLVQFAFRETREHTKEIVYPSPLPWIRGLKWGEYVGSPSAPDPVVCFSQPHGERFGSLQALPTRAICGLSRKFCLLMIYSKEQGVRSMHSTDIQWSAILSWGYADNILRLKSKQSEPPVNFIQSSQFHQVTSCAWVPDSCQLFTGSKCGVITAYMNRFTSCTPSEIDMESQMHLYGHTAEITSLLVCKPYSIMISSAMCKVLLGTKVLLQQCLLVKQQGTLQLFVIQVGVLSSGNCAN
ncbi:hypothetical protein Chor_006468, partial [Crotalus horridus]